MEICLGFATVIWIFFVLLFASISDIQTREVSNWVWILGLFGIFLAIFRMIIAGLLLPYGLQALLVFLLVITGFRIRILGGADVKAILLISFIYPWIILDFVWLIFASFFVLLGGFLLIGVHSLIVLFMNLITWKQISSNQDENLRPERRMFWITRRIIRKAPSSNMIEWEPVVVPLVLYFFVTYLVLLLLSSGPIFITS